MYIFGAVILCTILPSSVAFTSLVSAGAVPTIAAYGLIALLRLTCTRHEFTSSKFDLGKLKVPFYLSAVLFNALMVGVSALESPYTVHTPTDPYLAGVSLSIHLPEHCSNI
jgi:hypothetical protein